MTLRWPPDCRCVRLEPTWAKGHTRKAAALHGLGRYVEAVNAYDDALKYEPMAEALLIGRRQSSFALASTSAPVSAPVSTPESTQV